MGDPFLDSIERTLENGEVPQRVTNRMVLAALRNMDNKMDTQVEECNTHGVRLTILDRWQRKATGAITAAMFLGGGGFLITVVKLLGI